VLQRRDCNRTEPTPNTPNLNPAFGPRQTELNEPSFPADCTKPNCQAVKTIQTQTITLTEPNRTQMFGGLIPISNTDTCYVM